VYNELLQNQSLVQEKLLLVGNRIPRDFFITSGCGESNITIHAGSYHLALKDAGIERCNIVTYSSILPAIATEIEKPKELVHGSVMETIMACSHSRKGQLATAGIILGWLYDRTSGKKYGGLVCEYNGNDSEEEAKVNLEASFNELYVNGFIDDYEIKDIKIITKSFIPSKKFGTSIVALCFTNYIYPAVE
jgi:arginine decarboxylase